MDETKNTPSPEEPLEEAPQQEAQEAAVQEPAATDPLEELKAQLAAEHDSFLRLAAE